MIKLVFSIFGFSHYIFPCEPLLMETKAMSDHFPTVEGILVIVILETEVPQFCIGNMNRAINIQS